MNASHFPAKKSLGQHFLRDRGVLARIVAAAALGPDDRVFEIGAGDATLTTPLAAACGRLVALETDRRRLPALRARFPEGGRVDIVEADVLHYDLGALAPLAPLKCVANLPYNIATAVLDRLLARRGTFSLLVLMFQKEVARRLVAGPGDPAYGSLSLATQYRAEAELVFTVPRGAFAPPPKVESAVVRLVPRPEPLLPPEAERVFETLLRAGFAQRRKLFLNSAAASGRAIDRDALAAALHELGLTEKARAEEIPLEGFLRLATLLITTPAGKGAPRAH
ncbi:MAG TPA: 16S rRNA (adenine(1518)-N(6)/adenine(1519)-N(6))-dimethyltransferase RsmA [bacterium]